MNEGEEKKRESTQGSEEECRKCKKEFTIINATQDVDPFVPKIFGEKPDYAFCVSN